jgi:histidinol-phosphate aminotransferase
MYAVAARIQGAGVISVPLKTEPDFELDVPAICAALPDVKLVHLCTPNNPTGTRLGEAAIQQIIEAARGRALVVIDEAYAEFSAAPSWCRVIDREPHVVVLRTLSKAYGLAGVRIGSVIATPAIIELLRKIIPPYAIAQPTVEATLAALTPAQVEIMRTRRDEIVAAREQMAAALTAKASVLKIWRSDANFLLVRFAHMAAALQAIVGAGLIVREFRGAAGFGDALRITIGTPAQNARLLGSLT